MTRFLNCTGMVRVSVAQHTRSSLIASSAATPQPPQEAMRIVWVARIWLVVANTASLSFTIATAVLYQFFVTDSAIQIGLSQVGANTLHFSHLAFITAIAASIIHVLVTILPMSRARPLIDGTIAFLWQSRTKRVHPFENHVAPSYLQLAGIKLAQGKTLVTSAWSAYSAELTRLFMLWEVALQTFQAYKISYLVASVSINRLVALVIVTNCWFSPILHYAMGNRPVAHVRLGRLMLDSSLDVIYNIVIPLAIFYPYYRDFNGSVSLYPIVFYYDDTWYVNAVSELRQVFVTSWLDFISKFSGSLSLVYRLWRVNNAAGTAKMITTTVSRRAEVGRQAGFAKRKRWHLSRLSRLLDSVLVVWGATILSLHLTATITSFRFYDPDCLLEMRPWGSLAYSCASFEISYSKRHTTGDRETMAAILRTVDPLSVQNLILSNCEQLHVPTAIQRLKYLSMLKIYNSTIASWDVQSALRQVYHPQLQVIYFARVNASGIPDGLLADDFPNTVWDLEVCITNISTFPPATTSAWVNVGIIAFEGNPDLREVPEVLVSLRNVFALNFGMNNIKAIASDLFEARALLGVSLNGNPIESLPDTIGSIDQLVYISFMDTNVASIPASWMDIATQSPKPSESVVVSAGGSPLCEPRSILEVTKPVWIALNCELHSDALYAYPIHKEDAWRSINQ